MCRLVVLIASFSFLFSCVEKNETKLPILGPRVVEKEDTLYHTIPHFQFMDQNGAVVTNETFEDKIYVADFFFTSCITICPVMTTNMARLYKDIAYLKDVALLSHTIDPEYDTVELLHDFADRLGVSDNRWHFVTGSKDAVYRIAREGYFSTALEDSSEPGGFIHSGAFLLIDKDRRIRGKYDGTDESEVNQLIQDIKTLRREYE